MNTRISRLLVAAVVLVGGAPLAAHAAIVLETNFDQRLTFGFPSGPPIVNSANGEFLTGVDGFTSTVYDEAYFAATGQVRNDRATQFGGASRPFYVTGGAIPNPPSTLPPGWDGAAVRFDGENRWNILVPSEGDPPFDLAFEDSFSAFIRINRQGWVPGNFQQHYMIGNGSKGVNGWNIFLNSSFVSEAASSFNLDVSLGGELSSADPMDSLGAFGGNGPTIANNTWYDIGLVYTGTVADGIDDTLEVYLNGQSIANFTGDANFAPAPFTGMLNVGSDTFNQQGFSGLFERIILWDEAISDATMASLSNPVVTIMPDLNMDGWVDIFDVGIVSEHWMETGAPGITGDANKDGEVDIFDVGVISENWNPNPGGGGGQAVPEPSTWTLGALAGVLGLAFRRACTKRKGDGI